MSRIRQTGPARVLIVAACSCLLTACGAPGEGAQTPDPGESITSIPPGSELVCPGNTMDAQLDHVMSDPAFGHATAEDAIAADAADEPLPGGRDIEVTPSLWHRLDAAGRVIVEFRVGLSREGDYYLDGYTQCSSS